VRAVLILTTFVVVMATGCAPSNGNGWLVDCRFGTEPTLVAEARFKPWIEAGTLVYQNTEGKVIAYQLAPNELCVMEKKE
jgi:hypothetical protein